MAVAKAEGPKEMMVERVDVVRSPWWSNVHRRSFRFKRVKSRNRLTEVDGVVARQKRGLLQKCLKVGCDHCESRKISLNAALGLAGEERIKKTSRELQPQMVHNFPR